MEESAMFGMSSRKKHKSYLAPVRERPILSGMAGLTALSALGFGVWWALKRRRY